MADWKYILFEANGQQIPIIFPATLIHADVAKHMGYAVREHVLRARPGNWSSKLESAGFISGLAVTDVHGKSESLDNLASRPEDASTMNMMPYAHGLDSILEGVEPMLLIKIVEHLLTRIKELQGD